MKKKRKRVVAEPALSIHQRIKKMEKICVAVRLRPLVSQDSSSSSVGTFWKVEDNRISLHKIHGTPLSASSYAFGISSVISLASLFFLFFNFPSLIEFSFFQITYLTKEAPMLASTSFSPRTSFTPRSTASTVSKFISHSFLASTKHFIILPLTKWMNFRFKYLERKLCHS